MGTKDPRIDAYIARAADFARPILEHLRELVHTGCPAVEEDIKWGVPHFVYKGMLCSMAAFKAHCTFGFWKEEALRDVIGGDSSDEAMGQFGRIASLSDLPKERVLIRYVKAAAKLNDAGEKGRAPRAGKKEREELNVPADLEKALARNRKARATFEAFSYTNRKEYVEWITEARSEATRARRLATAVEWMAEGKIRHWKYARKKSEA